MPLKLVTFLLASSEDSRLTSAIEKLGDSMCLSDSTYLLDTPLSPNQVLTKLLKVVNLEDYVYVMEVSPFWSAYGEAGVDRFFSRQEQEGRSFPPTFSHSSPK